MCAVFGEGVCLLFEGVCLLFEGVCVMSACEPNDTRRCGREETPGAWRVWKDCGREVPSATETDVVRTVTKDGSKERLSEYPRRCLPRILSYI